MDSLSFSASHLAHEIAAGNISSEEYCRMLLQRVDTHQHLNAYALLDADVLLDAARRSDSALQSGDVHGPLHGVPLIIKDNINTASLPTSGGTPALKGNKPTTDAPLVKALLEAGALIAGKANLHELSSGGTSANHTFGPVRNPYDVSRVPGGSSGGTGAAIAARLAPAGIGTDTAGSVRVPASLCGIFGLRPTAGRYSADGIVPLSTSLDTAGPLARSIDDIVLLDQVISRQATDVVERDIRSIRLGIADNLLDNTAKESATVVRHTLERLSKVGVAINQVDLTPVRDIMSGVMATVIDFEFEEIMRTYLEDHAPSVSLDSLASQVASPAVKDFTQGRLTKEHDATAYERAQTEVLPAFNAAWNALLDAQDLDAIAFPTTPDPALPWTEDDKVLRNGESVLSWFYFWHTSFASFGRHPGISLPIGLTNAGLPVGLELDGRPGKDDDLLSTARAVASVLDPMPAPAG